MRQCGKCGCEFPIDGFPLGGYLCGWCFDSQNEPVPHEFQAWPHSGGELTGEQRERLFRLLDATIDDVLEGEAKDGTR